MKSNLIQLYWSIILTFPVVYFLNLQNLLQVIVIFGQAHFLVAYFYKHKSGRMDRKYILDFLSYFVVLAAVSTFVAYNPSLFNFLVFFTVMIFVAHYFFDELKILGFENGGIRSISILTVLFSFFCSFLVKTFGLTSSQVLPLIAVTLILTLYLLHLLLKEKYYPNDFKKISFYLFTGLNIFLPLLLIWSEVAMLKISAFIIVFHYIRWYFFYYDKLKNSSAELARYLDVVFWVHFLVLSLFVIYSTDQHKGILILFFNPIFFYGWTSLHIFLSVRKEDYLPLKLIWKR